MAIETDVLVVGAGPAGLATAISLKRRGYAGRVVVVDKGRSAGSHVLSGAVMDPSGFKELLTDEEMAKVTAKSLDHSEIINHFDPRLVQALNGMNIHE